MDFSWTPEQEQLRAKAAAVAADAVRRFGRSNDSWINGFSKEFSRELAAHGWIGMTWPDNPYSGTARPAIDRLIVGEEMIKAGAPIAAPASAQRWRIVGGRRVERSLDGQSLRLRAVGMTSFWGYLAGTVAAVIMEPLVQMAAGIYVHPPGFLRGVADLCQRHDVLLILDEVATGFGRTGTMFACCSDAASWISRSNRPVLSVAARSGESTLITTRRPSRFSTATNTRDMPPPPSSRSMA